MSTDAKKHTSLGPAERPSRAALAAAILSVSDVVPVANQTEQAQVAAAVIAAGINLATNPLVTIRADAAAWSKVEYSYDGSTWTPVFSEGSWASQLSDGLKLTDRAFEVTNANSATESGLYTLTTTASNHPNSGQRMGMIVVNCIGYVVQYAFQRNAQAPMFKRWMGTPDTPSSFTPWVTVLQEDAVFAAGRFTQAVAAVNTTYTTTVTLPTGRFGNIPAVVVNAETGVPQSVFCAAGSISSTNFVVSTRRSDAGTATSISWVAVIAP